MLAGVLLSVFATSNPLPSFGLTDLVTYAGIPILTGGLAGVADPENHVGNGILVGFLSGLSYAVMETVRLTTALPSNTSLFLVLTVPIWGLLGVTGSVSVYRMASTPSHPASVSMKVCGSCKTPNPPDASFCKNCGRKLSE